MLWDEISEITFGALVNNQLALTIQNKALTLKITPEQRDELKSLLIVHGVTVLSASRWPWKNAKLDRWFTEP